LIGRLKLFSQLFETEIPASGIVRAQNRRESLSQEWNGSVSNIPRAFWRVLPVGKPLHGVVESRAALADPGGEIGVLI
jgi:hypothetical protein